MNKKSAPTTTKRQITLSVVTLLVCIIAYAIAMQIANEYTYPDTNRFQNHEPEKVALFVNIIGLVLQLFFAFKMLHWRKLMPAVCILLQGYFTGWLVFAVTW